MDIDLTQIWDMLIKQGPLVAYLAFTVWRQDKRYAELVNRLIQASDDRARASASSIDAATQAFKVVKEKLDDTAKSH